MSLETLEKKEYNGYIGHRSRLREKYSKNGIESLADYEVLELLLTYAIPRKDVKPIAKELLESFGNIDFLTKADIENLTKINGVKENTALFIKLVGDVSKRIYRDKLKNDEMIHIKNKSDLLSYLRAEIGFENNELFSVLFLNSSNKLLAYEELFKGTIDKSAVYPRVILEKIIKYNAKSVIFAHNHPSGNARASIKDIEMTNMMCESLRMFDVAILDHIIITKTSYFSFLEEGLL